MRRPLLWMVFLTLAPGCWGLNLWGVDVPGIELQSSLWSIQNAVEDAAPDPVVNTLGASISIGLEDRWSLRAEAQVFTLGYAFRGGRAVPESAEWDNVSVLGIMLNPTAAYEVRFLPTLSGSAEGGMGFLLRAPVFLNGETAGEMAIPVTRWLMAWRFLYPSGGLGLGWQFSPSLTIHLRTQVFYPVFNLWTGSPWYDQLTWGVGLGIRLGL